MPPQSVSKWLPDGGAQPQLGITVVVGMSVDGRSGPASDYTERMVPGPYKKPSAWDENGY